MTLERRAVVEDETALEFHRGGALTFHGLESTGIIDRPPRLPFDERSCYPFRPVRLRRSIAPYDLAMERGRVRLNSFAELKEGPIKLVP